MHKFITNDSAHGKRLDQWLAQQLGSHSSRSRLQTLIRNGYVEINHVPILSPRFPLSQDLEILVRIPPPEDAKLEGENIPLDILYEDHDILVLNKPAGLVVHPGNGNGSGTLVNALIHHCGSHLSQIGGVKRPGIVHRLDKDTTGVMIIAQNDFAHRHLSQQFADHGKLGALKRKYQALVWGVPNRISGLIDMPLARSRSDRTRQTIAASTWSDSRHARTYYKVLETFPLTPSPLVESFSKNKNPFASSPALASLIECQLETGRTHQIRVHMAHMGHPLIGDTQYGNGFKSKINLLPDSEKKILAIFPRQALHAYSLTFEHPSTHEIMTFTQKIPEDMQTILSTLRNRSHQKNFNNSFIPD